MRMYVKVMAAVIACILLSGEALSAFATTPATENLSWFKKKKKIHVFYGSSTLARMYPLRRSPPLHGNAAPAQKRHPYIYALTHTEVLLLYGPPCRSAALYRNATLDFQHFATDP